MKAGETPISVGAANPVISPSAGPVSAASMPPAPNSSQNIGAVDRFAWRCALMTKGRGEGEMVKEHSAASDEAKQRQIGSAEEPAGTDYKSWASF